MVHWSLGNKVFRATRKYYSSWLAHSSFSGLPDFGLNILSASPPLYSYAKVTLRCCTDRCIQLLWQFMPPCRSNPLLKSGLSWWLWCEVLNTLYLKCLNAMFLYVGNGFKQISYYNLYTIYVYIISIQIYNCFCWQVFTRTCLHSSIQTIDFNMLHAKIIAWNLCQGAGGDGMITSATMDSKSLKANITTSRIFQMLM